DQLSGQEIGILQFCPETPLDEIIDHIAPRFLRFYGGAVIVPRVDDPQALRLDLDQHRDIIFHPAFVDLKTDLAHAANLDALEFHIGADGKTAHGAIEIEDVDNFLGIARIIAGRAVVIEPEAMPGRRNGRVARERGGGKLDAADDQALQRRCADLKSRRRDREVDAAGIPELRSLAHQLIIRAFNEGIDIDELLVVRKTVAEHAADIDPLVENRCPAIDIAELSGGKNIFRALLRRCDHGGNFEPGKGALRLTAIARVNL